ncbi:transcriptional regulator [Chromatiales bacterium (ex Bugula neritina AB1)]|nr:transcriptional regulator [Chromatiales bacterium (ex Bugula neritina AB1)]
MNINQFANIGMLIGEPARTTMLITLMNGQALTATELARCANITPQTASAHLARLTEAKLLSVYRQGRYRYHRIASPAIAKMLESVMEVAIGQAPARTVVTGPKDEAMRKARTCYDHFAGRLGVAITDSLIRSRYIKFDDEAGTLSKKGATHLESFGIAVAADNGKRKSRRPVCKPCLDWSERRPHVAGIVGRAICRHFLDEKFVKRIPGARSLRIAHEGELALAEIFAIRNFS